ncbi:EF-hand domain-containing protein [Granulosicoccus antarcticus]|uniref:EF-hand domain-containing protein n=1 Tax=Granulosicoccus antarcticus IMCC3135 TaxID=1192854 RepID=A0A2Z2NIS1_9GAMM|nr:EF-hand domain-containing protein [Granulosicoccus antarcticus]ASJ71236.1 hypothetical protein IMCC3135_05620 [Granulosicoccus antarcticus IMCC3135]
MKPNTSIPLILATALILGTTGVVAMAQDGENETINEQLMPEGPGDKAEQPQRHDKSGKEGHKKAHGKRHGRSGRQGSNIMLTLFKNADANADGKVTQEEIETYKNAQLSSADVDTDGALNIEEFDTIYRALTRSRMVDIFQSFDEDGDGIVSPAELDEKISPIVERMDRDDDGVLELKQGHGRSAK